MSDALAPGTKFSAHPAMFRARPFSLVLCLLLCVVVIGIPILIVWYVKCRSIKLEVNDNEVIFEQGFMSKERIELELSGIRSVRVYQSFLNRMTGVGRISVFTAGDDPEIVVEGIPDPGKFRDLT